jgi:hypothetical protein
MGNGETNIYPSFVRKKEKKRNLLMRENDVGRQASLNPKKRS